MKVLTVAFLLLPAFLLPPVLSARAADSDVVINEIMYHPDTDCEKEEFIELYNRSTTEPVNLAGWRFSEGVAYTFPAGTVLPPRGYLVVCENIPAFLSYYSTPSIALLGPWSGKLANDGEDIRLVNAASTLIDVVRYNDKRPWPISPDGGGPSLELINPDDDNTSAGAWRAATANWISTTWRRYEVTGIPASREVYFYLDSAGECLIDEVELRETLNPTANYILNGSFETASPLQWTAAGNHAASARTTADAYAGGACLRLSANSAGGAFSGQVWQQCAPLTLGGAQYTLSFWAKGLRPGMVLRAGVRGAPTAWSPTNSVDIGTAPGGGHSYDSGTQTWRVWGSGSDIWGTTDNFHFSYATLTGDGSLEAEVARVANPGGYAAALGGIMIRESTANNSKYVCIHLRWSGSVNFFYRAATGGSAASIAGPATAGPVPLRLTRIGNRFIAEADTGGGWTQVAATTITMNSSVLIGFAVCSYDNTVPNSDLATYDFVQPEGAAPPGFYTEVRVPGFYATPGARNSVWASNTPPYIRNVDTSPDQPTSADPIVVRAKITDADGIASTVLQYQIVRPGRYIRLGDAAYQTSWTAVAMAPATTPTYYVATIPAQPHRTLVRYRVAAQDGAGQKTTVPYPDDSEPNYARFVYDGVPNYVASPNPAWTTCTARTHTVLTKVPVFHLIADAADTSEAQSVTITDKIERRQFKWYGTVYFNGKVYDHIRYRMRGGTWRYRYQKRMWKFRFNRGHRLEFIRNDGTRYESELRTLNLLSCFQPPGNVPSWLWLAPPLGRGYHTNSQRGEAGIVERAAYWLLQQVGGIAPECTWIHYRIVDEAGETGANQYAGDFFGLFLAVQGMDESLLEMNNRPAGNLYKIDSFGAAPGEPPWDQEAVDCSLPANDIVEFRRQYGPKSGYPTPTRQWWEQNFDLDSYFSCRAIIDCIHHGDLYDTTTYDGVGTGKNYYYYHNSATGKWEFTFWDVDLTFGTDHGAGSSPFRDRVIRRYALDPGGSPEFQAFEIAYKNRLREVIQLLFCEEKFFPQLDEWRNLLVEISEADRDRWDYAPQTGPDDDNFTWSNLDRRTPPPPPFHGKFPPITQTSPTYGPIAIDVRLNDIKHWIRNRINWLTNPLRAWWLERAAAWPATTCWDPDIPATPTLTAPPPVLVVSAGSPVLLQSSAFSDPNGDAHAASKWIATRAGGNELKPDWSSGITTQGLTSAAIPAGVLRPGTYWLRVRHGDSTDRWSWWSALGTLSVGQSSGSIVIDSGAPLTTRTAVTLSLSAQSTAPVTQMQFSNDGMAWSAWQPFASSAPWTLSPGDGTKIVYFRFKDSNGTESAAHGDSILLDTTGPTGSIVIAGGAAATNTPFVGLTLSATDNIGAVAQMRFSNNGATWSAWQAYATAEVWTLSAGDGIKTVYVQFKDTAGNVSPAYTDTIRLDTTPPAGSIVINSGAAWTNTLLATLTVSASDAGSGVALMRFSNNGTVWSAWESYTTSKAWTLAAGDGLKTVYVQFYDAVGNISGSFTDTIQLDTVAPTGSIVINDGAATTSLAAVTLRLTASDTGSGSVQMRFSNDGTTWGTWQPFSTQKAWNLLSGTGLRIVYVQYRDAAGNLSFVYSDTIYLDPNYRTRARRWELY